jgi:hypothetical protein
MRRRLIFVVASGCLGAAACSLNPQPLPPDQAGDAGEGAFGGGGDASAGLDATTNPAPGTDGGGPDGGDAAFQSDAAPEGDAATDGGRDGETDGEADGESDAAPDADLDASGAAD